MTTPPIPRNAYTNAPEQHPNLILGSLQLLFWLVFRPSAWTNHVQRLTQTSDSNFLLFHLLRNQRWKQWEVWRFLLQGFFMLPFLVSLSTGLALLSSGLPLVKASLGVANAVPNAVAAGSLLGVAGGVAFDMVAFGVVGGVVVGMMRGVAGGVAFGIAFDVALLINLWRPLLMYVLLLPWNSLLYRKDQGRVGKLPSLLHRHPAFWDEWQYLPIWGLDKHLLLVLKHSPAEGRAALDYLSTSRQRWAAQAAQIELDACQLERCTDLAAIAQAYYRLTAEELTGSADTLLRSFQRISEDVEAAVNQDSAYNQQLALNVIRERLDGLLLELNRSSDKYATRLRPIARGWSEVIAQHI